MKNPTKVEPINAVVKSMKAEVKTMTPIEKGKALAKATQKPEVVVKTTEVAKPVVKEVIPFGQRAKLVEKPVESQTSYEKRYYLRNFHEETVNEKLVTHLTSHTTAQITERLLAELQKMFAERKTDMVERDTFRTRDIIDRFTTFGPACGDIVRSSFRKLAKSKQVEIIPVEQGRRTTYKFKLLELTAPAPQVAQK